MRNTQHSGAVLCSYQSCRKRGKVLRAGQQSSDVRRHLLYPAESFCSVSLETTLPGFFVKCIPVGLANGRLWQKNGQQRIQGISVCHSVSSSAPSRQPFQFSLDGGLSAYGNPASSVSPQTWMCWQCHAVPTCGFSFLALPSVCKQPLFLSSLEACSLS